MYHLNDRRRLWKYILFGILTFGIYDLIFTWTMIRDMNTACGAVEQYDREDSPNLIVVALLGVITLGIYLYVWYYKQGNRMHKCGPRYGMNIAETGGSYVLWILFGVLLFGIGPIVAFYLFMCNVNKLCGAYNRMLDAQSQMPQMPQPAMNPALGAVSNAGYTAVTPVTGMDQTQGSSAWRDVQQTGKAKTDYQALMGAQPGAYQSLYGTQTQQTLNNLLGQQPFQYDVNTDALYQQIKDNYIRNGRQAMMNTQGQSAALTGGYGNSYGVLAGQQAYQDSLGNLSAQIPELYKLAYNRYLGDENSQRQNLAALQGLDQTDYQRYQYDVQQYETKLADAYKKYQASQGSGGKRTDPRKDAEWFINYSDYTGLDVDASIDSVATQMGWTPQYTESVKTITHQYTDYQKDKNIDDHINGN